jgi:hypothetical protein
MKHNWKKAETFDEVMALEWDLDKDGYFNLSVEVNDCKAFFFIQPRPNYCDRGHWFVMCDFFTNSEGINTLDHADLFPRPYMSLSVAKDEIQRFIAWRALKVSEGSEELFKHHNDTIQKAFQ